MAKTVSRKVTVGPGIGGSLTVILVWLIETAAPTVVVPGTVAGAMAAVLSGLFGYFIREKGV